MFLSIETEKKVEEFSPILNFLDNTIYMLYI